MKVKRPAFLLIFFIFLISTASAQENSNQTAQAVISDDLRILEYAFGPNGLEATFESDAPTRIIVVDANSIADSGSSKPNVKSKQLGIGKTNLTMELEPGPDDSVFISTSSQDFITLSDPGKPFLIGIGFSDLIYAVASTPVLTGLVVLGLRKWERYRLGQGVRWDG